MLVYPSLHASPASPWDRLLIAVSIAVSIAVIACRVTVTGERAITLHVLERASTLCVILTSEVSQTGWRQSGHWRHTFAPDDTCTRPSIVGIPTGMEPSAVV